MKFWRNSLGKFIRDVNGKLVRCDTCPSCSDNSFLLCTARWPTMLTVVFQFVKQQYNCATDPSDTIGAPIVTDTWSTTASLIHIGTAFTLARAWWAIDDEAGWARDLDLFGNPVRAWDPACDAGTQPRYTPQVAAPYSIGDDDPTVMTDKTALLSIACRPLDASPPGPAPLVVDYSDPVGGDSYMLSSSNPLAASGIHDVLGDIGGPTGVWTCDGGTTCWFGTLSISISGAAA